MTDARGESPAIAWTLFAAGVLACVYAWQIRQPVGTSDFTILYTSATRPAARMYEPPPGARANMNPPHVQLLLRPLTALPLGAASAVFRGISLACLAGCVFWLWRTADERWTMADVGVLLAWTPMAAMLSLNQVTWIMWPLLVATVVAWRSGRWTRGALAYGVALSIKPFLGVVLIWLVMARRWRAAATAVAVAAGSLAVGVLAYGVDPFRQWIAALRGVQWTAAPMNASIEGWIARTFASQSIPGLVIALAVLVLVLAAVRRVPVEEGWTLLVATAVLVSPLGWSYYLWWVFPGRRPFRVFLAAPLLWVPWAYVPVTASSRLAAATIGSVYFWGLAMLCVREAWRVRRFAISGSACDRAPRRP